MASCDWLHIYRWLFRFNSRWANLARATPGNGRSIAGLQAKT